jgi:hypothetical protein
LLLNVAFALDAKVVVFWEEGFPAVESQPVSRETLGRALQSLGPVSFASLDDLARPETLRGADLLVLPYGSAVPVDGWGTILAHLQAGGNLLTLGGRPLYVPVARQDGRFVTGRAQNTYARQLGISHSYAAPQTNLSRFVWDESCSFLRPVDLRALKVYVATGSSGLGFLLDANAEKAAAPVVKRDFTRDSRMLGARCVFLNFEPAPGFWSSAGGIRLIQEAAGYAGQGAAWLRLEVQNATLVEGEIPQVVVQLRNARKQRLGQPLEGVVRVELLSGDRVLASREVTCSGDTLAANVEFRSSLSPGLYFVRAVYREGDRVREAYRTGFWSRDAKLLTSGAAVRAAGDYFSKNGAPFLPFGTNYFSTDIYGGRFEDGGNAYVWDRDFAEMEKHGVTFVRTGIWGGNADFVDRLTGGAEERFLRALEAYLHAAARHNIQVHFTFWAFDPQTIRRYPGETPLQFGPGSNPYTDPVAIRAQKNYVYSIVNRFRDVPHLSWDLINEPSFSNPRRLWRTIPNGDPTEVAAWNRWLEKRYKSIGELAEAWAASPEELGNFGRIPLPAPEDLELRRYGNSRLARAVDYNLFAQDAFNRWVSEMISTIRSTGNQRLITVGQDEGGVTNRLLNQFYGSSGVDFTVNHTWWQDDALLWDSVAAKRPDLPNLIGETGVQPAWRADGAWRWDEVTSFGLLERKLALGFAAGNSGALQWDWGRSDTFGIKRGDGSNKSWMDMVGALGEFAKKAAPYFGRVKLPETAIVLPQSLQLSVFNRYALEAQQKCVRALYHCARAEAYVAGEYQLQLLGDPKLIIVPSPWVLNERAWETILAKVRGGSTLLLSGRFDTDEHFHPQPRAQTLGIDYRPGLLDARENLVRWTGPALHLSYSGDKCTYLERGVLASGETFVQKPLGAGRVLYFALPLELSEDLGAIGAVYRLALDQAKVRRTYTTEVQDPGILICPTRLEAATLYVLTSESSSRQSFSFRDLAAGKSFQCRLNPGRAALGLIRQDGELVSSYNW